jgi:hypothetical protein
MESKSTTNCLGLVLPKYGINVETGIAPDGITNAAEYNLRLIDEAIEELQASSGTPPARIGPGRTLFVDGTRTDAYTEDGTFQRPFKTVMAAVNQVVANGDNSLAKPYDIVIVSPSTFAETIDLGNAAIVSLNINAYDGAVINPASGNALQSLANNNGFLKAKIRNLQFAGPIALSNPIDGGTMGQQIIEFTGCIFSAGFSAANLMFLGFTDCDFGQITTTTLTNIGQGYCYANNSGHNGSTLVLNTDNSQPKPNGFSGTYFLNQASPLGFSTVKLFSSQFDLDIGAIAGRTGGTIDIETGALLRVFHSATVSSDITVASGGELRMMGGALRGAVTIQSGGVYSAQASVIADIFQARTFECGLAPSGNPQILSGTGVPTMPVTNGSLYLRLDGVAGSTLYVREAGAWVAK